MVCTYPVSTPDVYLLSMTCGPHQHSFLHSVNRACVMAYFRPYSRCKKLVAKGFPPTWLLLTSLSERIRIAYYYRLCRATCIATQSHLLKCATISFNIVSIIEGSEIVEYCEIKKIQRALHSLYF